MKKRYIVKVFPPPDSKLSTVTFRYWTRTKSQEEATRLREVLPLDWFVFWARCY